MPRSVRPASLGALVASVAAIVPAGASADPFVLLYTRAPAADAVHDGGPGVPGVAGAHRQAPAAEDPRFPAARRVGKVSGRVLSGLDAAGMARALRAGWDAPGVGDLVAVDEIGAADFTAARLAALDRAMTLLGQDADRVLLYIAPGLMQRVGRVDRRRALPPLEAATVRAAARAGRTLLPAYHGGAVPFTRRELARDLTGWVARWPADRATRLHVVVGPEAGTSQAEIWDRVRATPAGRALLANGPAAYGLRDADEGIRWLRQYRGFLLDPAAPPPGGAARVPEGGGLSLAAASAVRPGGTLRVDIARPGRAVVRLIPLPRGRGRVIRAFTGPASAAVRLPADVRPGPYEVRVTLLGDGIRDVARRRITVPPPAPAVRLTLAARHRAVAVTVGRGDRAVIRVTPPGGRGRVIAKVRGPAIRRIVPLPRDLRPGPHAVVAVSAGAGGRQEARTRVVVPRP